MTLPSLTQRLIDAIREIDAACPCRYMDGVVLEGYYDPHTCRLTCDCIVSNAGRFCTQPIHAIGTRLREGMREMVLHVRERDSTELDYEDAMRDNAAALAVIEKEGRPS